ncbi:MAG: glycosyltransferase family 9 protein [Myxococcota bacterium]|nr:glycosyltransferase family 9 protein [Myxococcota bacterium]
MTQLRREKYQIALDAGNPTVPSLTHHLMTRLAGAQYCGAITELQFSEMFDHACGIPKAQQDTSHEIEMRLELLRQFPPHTQVTTPSLTAPQCPKADAILKLHNLHHHPFFILNLGARLKEKQLSPQQYVALAYIMGGQGVPILCTWGPTEKAIADSISKNCDRVIVAPDTNLQTLSALMAAATATVSCDTGPMHLSVALGTPTCGIFVSTDPTRYGYKTSLNQIIDAREGFHPEKAQELQAWISQFRS